MGRSHTSTCDGGGGGKGKKRERAGGTIGKAVVQHRSAPGGKRGKSISSPTIVACPDSTAQGKRAIQAGGALSNYLTHGEVLRL